MIDYQKEKVKLSLKLYKTKHVHRAGVQSLIDYFNGFLTVSFLALQQELCRDLEDVDKKIINRMKVTIHRFKNPLNPINTEKKYFKLYKDLKIYVEPKEYDIGVKNVISKQGVVVEKIVKGTYVPLKDQLETFFSIPGVYDEMKKYENFLMQQSKVTNIYSNVIQTKIWQKYKDKYPHLNIAPINGFFDDFTAGNALGSHADGQKFGGAYVALPTLPPHLRAKIKNIFLSSVFYSKDRTECGNEAVFRPFIDELNKLSKDGIEFKSGTKKIKLHFCCVLIVGDNAGLNQSCGFYCSSGEFYCRICRMPAKLCKITTVELPEYLRNKDNYMLDLATLSHGIKEECVFNEVIDFSIAENFSLDIMHDIMEGTARYIIVNVLNRLILKDKIISLETVNNCIAQFDYGPIDKNNQPRPLHVDYGNSQIPGSSQTIVCKQSASEMLCLVRYLGVMIGHLIPKDDKYWQLYRTLRKKIGIVTAPSFRKSDLTELKDIVKLQNEDLMVLFQDLMHKAHNDLHLTTVMELNGPPIHYWSNPFERKNRELKLYATGTSSKINVPYSIAVRNQICMACLKLHCEDVEGYVSLGSISETETDDEFKKLNKNIKGDVNSCTYNYVKVNGKKIICGSIIVVEIGKKEIVFGRVIKIYKAKNQIYFYVQNYKTERFVSYYHAYEVTETSNASLIHVDQLPKVDPCLLVKHSEGNFVVTRYNL